MEIRRVSKETLIAAFLIIALFGLYSLGMTRLGYSIPDEKRYIQSTKEMVKSGDYITPRYHGELRFQKPILFYWLIVLSYKIWGVGIYGARFPSIVAALLNVVLIYLIGKNLFNKKTGIFSALILSTGEVFFMYARFSTPDMVFYLFIAASVYLFIKAYCGRQRGNSRYIYMYIPMALAMLTKGPLGFIYPMLTISLFAVFRKEWNIFKEMSLLPGLFLFAAISAPWFMAMILIHGEKYLGNVWTMEIVKKTNLFSSGFNANLLVHYFKSFFYYAGMIFARNLPWSIFLPASLAATRNNVKQSNRGWALAFVAAWFFAVFISLVLIWSKESYYILALSMPLALFMGKYMADLTENSVLLKSGLFRLPFIVVIVLILITALLWLGFIYYVLNKPILSFSLVILAVPVFLLSAYLGKNKMPLPVSIFAAAFAFFAYFAGYIVPAIVGKEPLLKVAEEIKSYAKPADSIGVASSEVSYHRLNAMLENYKVIRVVENLITDWNQQRDLIIKFVSPKTGRAFCIITKDDYYEYLDENLRNKLYIMDRFLEWKKMHNQNTEYFKKLLSYILEGKRELFQQSLKVEVYLVSNKGY